MAASLASTTKSIRFRHPEYGLIVKADLEWKDGDVVINNINFGLPVKASKLEKLLLKYVEIYCHDVLRNNMIATITQSMEYHKFAVAHRPLGV